jgi:hypothetical protein
MVFFLLILFSPFSKVKQLWLRKSAAGFSLIEWLE